MTLGRFDKQRQSEFRMATGSLPSRPPLKIPAHFKFGRLQIAATDG